MKISVLDSYALISFLEKEKSYSRVAGLFEESITGNSELFMSIVNWGEIIYLTLREGGEQKAQLAREALKALPLNIVGLDEKDRELTLIAARFKASHKMSYADCFAAALAKKLRCELVTGDKEFKQLEKEIKIHWIE